MILLCLLILCAPPIAPSSAAVSGAPAAIDWANHDFGLFALRDGSAEMRDYPMDGTPHDSQRWRFVRAEPARGAGAPYMIVLIAEEYSAPNISRESLTAYLFKGGTQVGRQIVVPTRSAQIKVDGDTLTGRWRVGIERFVQRWHVTDKGLIPLGNASTLRPRPLGH